MDKKVVLFGKWILRISLKPNLSPQDIYDAVSSLNITLAGKVAGLVRDDKQYKMALRGRTHDSKIAAIKAVRRLGHWTLSNGESIYPSLYDAKTWVDTFDIYFNF